MKTANFPAAKNARRERALERIAAAPTRYDGTFMGGESRESLIANTKANLVPTPRAVMTKKYRGKEARFSR
jgi:hypothetical protein